MNQTSTASPLGIDASGADGGADALRLSADENRRLMEIMCRAKAIRRHAELFDLLRGETQYFLPHQILLSAWGDFATGELQVDIVSALPGMRTAQLAGHSASRLARKLHELWTDSGRRPMLLDGSLNAQVPEDDGRCALHRHLRGTRALLVHGTHSARDNTDTLYLASHCDALSGIKDTERFRRLIDLVITQIDIAFHRVAGFWVPGATAAHRPAALLAALSEREQEIMSLVSLGRTNFEIALLLGISGNTVKNHVQRIIHKLGATNRTEAASLFRARDRRRLLPAVGAPAGGAGAPVNDVGRNAPEQV